MSTLTKWLIALAVTVAVGHYAAVESISAHQEAEDVASDLALAKRQAIAERRAQRWKAAVEASYRMEARK